MDRSAIAGRRAELLYLKDLNVINYKLMVIPSATVL